jgi:predicted RNA binding protein YcfA (HicA-like mRNA interferase family)
MSFQRRKILHALAAQGGRIIRDTGPHTIIAFPDGRQTAIPRHREIERGTARKIAKQLRLDVERFLEDIR